MTVLKLKENTKNRDKSIQKIADDLGLGDMLYSHEYDTLLLVTLDQNEGSGMRLIDVSSGISVEDKGGFAATLESYDTEYGPFRVVRKAKVEFKL